ncbi:hypothetical protein QBC37DRAFT_333505 [Rhypophila decipiens]|uniref:Uncharacterized protein n=1 Tax=Rhypophila decipiens TaxID=261697 RepID=A0AAN7BCK0_9PEZI|nr:hypothetical protein QBC37DRAFT_333505 [Rhypophila decipiens]
MASPAVASPHVNGVATLSRPDSPASINSSTKRKRDSDDDDEPRKNGAQQPKPTINGVQPSQDHKSLLRDFFDVLQRIDTTGAELLKRPIPESEEGGEPSPKRAKSEEGGAHLSITDKFQQDTYAVLDDLIADMTQVFKSYVKELESTAPKDNPSANDDKIARALAFKRKVFDMYRRELAYPNIPPPPPSKVDLKEALPSSATGSLVLTAVGAAPTLKPLFTSLQRSTTPDGVFMPLADASLPKGVLTTDILPDVVPQSDKAGRTLTLGELFPSPRNLPPLQPPKVPKTTTKSNILGFYHPELTEKSKYSSGTYFSQTVPTGNWLDYSNATPTTRAKTKQRERAQSLAGVKPSSVELELSEMESLFRGAFSSFAPCKDDSGATIPSSHVGRIWWQRVGRRNFEKLVESDVPEEDRVVDLADEASSAMEIDEEQVKTAIENWDDSMAIDPTLDQVLGKKSDEDKEVDDLLEEVSDLIETLASYQRNRNLTLPTSQDRFSADPVNGDMLRNGGLSHQPSEEEMLTYQALKSQLSLIIRTLPPYAVARINSDKLEELNVSTMIEIRTDEYKGVMEEDEPARLARQQAANQTAATANQRQPHRAPSVSAASPFTPHQYPGQFAPAPRPIANAQHFPQTPVRPQPPNVYPQRAPSSVPLPQQHHPVQPRQPPQTQYRPPNPYPGYTPQLAKAQPQYGHSNMQSYVSPTQPRMQPHPGYGQGPPGPSPNQRFTPTFPGGYQQHQPQQHPPMHPAQPQNPQLQLAPHHPPHPQQQLHHALQPQHPQQHHPQHPQHGQHPQHPQHPQHQQLPQHGYSPYPNGGQMPRNMSPQVPPPHPYGQSPTPPQHQQMPRPPYGNPGQAMQLNPGQPHPGQRQYSSGSVPPGMIPPGGPGGRPGQLTGYATVMPEVQQRQVMEQARARADAEQRVAGHMGKVTQGEVVGLAGIGLGGNVDVHKLAAAKAMQMGNNAMSPSPKMHMNMHGAGHSPSPVNGAVGSPIPLPQTVHQQQQARMAAATQHQHHQQPHPQGMPSPAPMAGTPGGIRPV